MGARQSKRSVDITTTPKKDGLPIEGVVGDVAAPGDGKLEKIEETDAKPTTNGVAPHTDATPEDKDKDKDEATEKEAEKQGEEIKAEEAKVESPTTEAPAEGAAEVTTPTEETPASPTTATSPDSKETKKKDKLKKKWSFRSISFGKKDKSKPAREETPKNGDITKEEPLTEGGEEVEVAEPAAVASPTEDKSAVSSPTEKEQSGAVEAAATPETAKPEENKTVPTNVASSPTVAAANEKKDENTTPAPTPVPVEAAKKVEDLEKQVEPAKADKKVEVSQVKAVIDRDDEAPVEVNSLSKQKKATTAITAPSIIERKTSEDFPSQFPSSPPPTPIDPSPLQQAQQVAANATALAEALKLPAEAANKANISYASGHNIAGNITSSPTTATTTTWPVESVETSNPKSNQPIEKQTAIVTKSTVSPAQTLNDPLPNIESSLLESTQIEKPSSLIHENIVEPLIETIETHGKMHENEICGLRVEEAPVPVPDDIIVEAKPAIVVPDSPLEEEKKVVEVLLEKKLDDESPATNESSEGLLVQSAEKIPSSIESAETFVESIVEPIPQLSSEDIADSDIPPPLPESPIPMPKLATQILNFMTSEIEDSSAITPVIDGAAQLPTTLPDIPPVPEVVNDVEKNVAKSPEDVQSESSPQLINPSETSEDIEEIEETDESHSHADEQRPPPEAVPGLQESDDTSQAVDADDIADLPPPQEILDESPLIPHAENAVSTEIPVSDLDLIPDAPIPSISVESNIEALLTPPRSPINGTNHLDIEETSPKESASELSDDQSNREFKMESVNQSLNSFNDSELELKERLTESMEDNTTVNCLITIANNEKNDQNKTEPEAPVENNIVQNDIGTTEVNDEAPKCPPPAIPIEISSPIGPVITEDVASVTKAIEEIDINEKAVAAAVNENIDSINTNEIIADMNHQNNMNE